MAPAPSSMQQGRMKPPRLLAALLMEGGHRASMQGTCSCVLSLKWLLNSLISEIMRQLQVL